MHTFSITFSKERLSGGVSTAVEALGSLVEINEIKGEMAEALAAKTEAITLQFGPAAFRQEFHRLRALAEQLIGYDETECEADGIPLSGSRLLAVFDRVQDEEQRITEAQQRQDVRPDGWGYAALDAISRYLPEERERLFTEVFWFQIGHFVQEGLWQVDKHQMLAILRQQAEDKLLHLCPSFDFASTEAIIQRLPEHIDTNENPNWATYYTRRVVGSRVERKPAGIIHKLTSAGGGKKSFGAAEENAPEESAASEASQERKRNIPKISFDEIGGIDDIITQVREVIELPLRKPELFKHLGITPHKGMMLYGAPGCGKTMVAKAIANEVEAHFISVKGPELINKYQGASEENLRELFDEAREMQPAIIFFDEIDAIAQSRSDAETLRTDARFVNQLLSLMDGVEEYGRICVIGATNRVELIDQALLRPGRFDYQLEVKKPDAEGCRKIFEIVTKDMPVEAQMDKPEFGRGLEGFTGAEISFIAREAAYNSLRRNLHTDEGFDLEKMEHYDLSAITISEADMNKARQKLMGNAGGSGKPGKSSLEARLQAAIDTEVQPQENQ
ncbi:MAG: ATP-binding protein [Cyclonatronaceae bacterium]